MGTVELNLAEHELMFYSECDDYLISNLFYGTSDEEIEEFEFLAKNLVSGHGNKYLDIGSYNGIFALIMSKCDPNGLITAFEPHPANFQRIKKNVLLNKTENIRCVNAGVSDKTGRLSFYIPTDNSMTTVSSFNKRFTSNHGEVSLAKIEVETIDLDNYCKHKHFVPDFVKIDVEGHELAVFKGAEETIRRFRPTILCEIFTKSFQSTQEFKENLPAVHAIESMLSAQNYGIFILRGGQLAELASLNTNYQGRNFIFMPKKHNKSSFVGNK